MASMQQRQVGSALQQATLLLAAVSQLFTCLRDYLQ
jgi:hypothetical protein